MGLVSGYDKVAKGYLYLHKYEVQVFVDKCMTIMLLTPPFTIYLTLFYMYESECILFNYVFYTICALYSLKEKCLLVSTTQSDY